MTEKMTAAEYRSLNDASRRAAEKPRRRQGEFENQATFFGILKFNEREFPFLKFVFAVPNAAKRTGFERFAKSAEGMRAGVPDIVFPFQRRGYPGAYVENKFGRNALSPAQMEFKRHLESEGYCFRTCRTVDQQIKFAEWFFGIELTK